MATTLGDETPPASQTGDPGPLDIALIHAYPLAEVRRGGERYVDDLARYLGASGHRVTSISGTNGAPGTFPNDGFVERRYRHRREGRLGRLTDADRLAFAALPHFVHRRYDVVHAFLPEVAIAAATTAHPVLFTCLGHPSGEALHQLGGGARERFATAAWVATRFAALSESAAHAVRWTHRRTEVLSPGVRLDEFPTKRGGDRRPGPLRILFASDASAQNKGVDLALAAVADLVAGGTDVVLQLGGPGDHRWALELLGERASAAAGVTEVLGVGALDELPARYRDADITLLPSRGEAFGLVLVESLASGTPVVCSSSGGMAEIVDDRDVGRVFRSDDVGDLGRALTEVAALAHQASTPERCARHAARWGWNESIGPQHVAMYLETLRARHRTAR